MNLLFLSSLVSLILPIIILIIASFTYMRRTTDREKTSPFECGFDPINSARIPFSTRFFLLAVIFIVFDIEIVLLIPTPIIILSSNKTFLIISLLLFIIILIIGLLHE